MHIEEQPLSVSNKIMERGLAIDLSPVVAVQCRLLKESNIFAICTHRVSLVICQQPDQMT